LNINSSFIQTEKRIELKEVFENQDRNLIDRAISVSRFSFRQTYPNRIVNSLYLDTLNFKSLEESIEGGSLRRKARIRWYGKQLSETDATLEFKLKHGHLSWKKLLKKAFIIDPSENSWDKFVSPTSYNGIAISYLYNLIPQSIVSYHRSYYASFDDKVRITIDRELQTYSQLSSLYCNLKYEKLFLNKIIMEIKVSENNQIILKEVLNDFPFSQKRFSKYCASLI
jgi:hypothetical protein